MEDKTEETTLVGVSTLFKYVMLLPHKKLGDCRGGLQRGMAEGVIESPPLPVCSSGDTIW